MENTIWPNEGLEHDNNFQNDEDEQQLARLVLWMIKNFAK